MALTVEVHALESLWVETMDVLQEMFPNGDLKEMSLF